ncbi:MAG: sugar ABC transporter substrate-binding protein [Desulfurococcaceae archaeon]
MDKVNRSRREFLMLLGGLAIGTAVGYVIGSLPKPAPVTSPTPTPEKTIPPEIEEIRRKYAGTTIRVATYAGPESELLMYGLYRPFEELTGIRVIVETYDEPTLREKMLLDFRERTGYYDVVRVQFWHMPEYFINGWLEPLDPYIESSLISEWLDLNQFPERARNAFKYGGNLYVIPDCLLTSLSIYRKDIFENEGWSFPTTLDKYYELLNEFKKLKERGKYTDMYGTWGRGYPQFDAYGSISGWAWAYGAKSLDEEYNPLIDSPEFTEAMTDWINMLREHGPPGQATIGWVKGGELYCAGAILMQTEVSGFGNYVNNPEKSSIVGKNGFSVAPIGPSNEHVQWFFSTGLGINKFSNKKEAAWAFIQWRSSAEAYRLEVENNIRFDMPYRAAYTWDIHKKKAEELNVTGYVNTLPDAHAYATAEHWPLIPQFNEFAEIVATEISNAIAGIKSVREALAEAQTKTKRLLEETKDLIKALREAQASA